MNLIRCDRPAISARANWGRWVGDCPFCPSAMKLAQQQAAFTCRECGTDCEVVWPAFADGVERLLMLRPDVTTRNWVPGETLHDLLEENAQHGVGFTSGGQSIMIVGDEIVRDTLPASPQRLKIGA